MRFSIYKWDFQNRKWWYKKQTPFCKIAIFQARFSAWMRWHMCVCVRWFCLKNEQCDLDSPQGILCLQDILREFHTRFMCFSRFHASFLPFLIFLALSLSLSCFAHKHISSESHFVIYHVYKKLLQKTSDVELRIQRFFFCSSFFRNKGNRKIIRYQIDLELFTNCKMIFEIKVKDPYWNCFCSCSVYTVRLGRYFSDGSIKSHR